MLQAIIFDMDGVIVDTEYVEFALQKEFIQAVKERPDEITKQEYLQVVGKALKDIAKIIKKITGATLSQEELAKRYYAFFHSIFDEMDYLTIFRKDIKNIIQFAKQNNIKLAVASSSPMAHIENILTQCGIINDFDLIVTGDLFAESKPNPEIYQYTMQKLGVLPEHSVAIEDSYFGMVAAKAAGMICIGYEETRMEINQSLADYIGKDMNEILAIIKQLAN